MGDGTLDKPWSLSEVQKHVKHGNAAVTAVEKKEGITLDPTQSRIAKLEGYVNGYYYDEKGVVTTGMGQTGKYMESGFLSAYNEKYAVAESTFTNFGAYPEALQTELVSLVYRGDVKKKYNFVHQLNNNEFLEAADSLLVNKDYNKAKAANNGKGNGISKRFEAAQDAMFDHWFSLQ